jgi:hypothetical protein
VEAFMVTPNRFGRAGFLALGWICMGGGVASAAPGVIDQSTVTNLPSTGTASNGLLTIHASPRGFNNSPLNIGISGGRNNASVDNNGVETEVMDVVFDATVGWQSFKTAWTDGHIHLDGFASDPGLYVITDPAVSTIPITIDPYADGEVVIHHSWQNNTLAEFGFSNTTASAGQTIQVFVEATVIDTSGPQVGINEFVYTDIASGTLVYTSGLELVSNNAASSDDGLVTMTASPRNFSFGGSFFGVSGGSNNDALDNNVDGGTNAVPGEIIEFSFDESVGPFSFSTQWSRSQIVWEGWTEDPEAYVITDPGASGTPISVLPYDPSNQWVVINHPWQGGEIAEIGFRNPGAGAGQTLRLWVYDPNETNPQVALIDVRYGEPPLRLLIDSAEWTEGGGGPALAINWTSATGDVFAVETTLAATGGWSAIETNIAATPPTNSYSVAADPDALFVRITKEAPGGILFSDDLEAADTDTRWSHTVSNGLDWERGAPQPLTPPTAGPAAAYSGANCYGTDLDGFFGVNQTPSLRSPPINLAGVSEATLSFQQFRDMEESGSQTTPFLFDTGVVNLLRASDNSVITADVYVTEGTSADWELVDIPLPVAALGQQIIVEWVFNADGFQGTDQGGWYIDDIEVVAP